MNRENIIAMARAAGCHDNGEEFRFVELRYLERFAALVAKHTLSNIDPRKFMSWQEGYAAGAAAERKVIMDSLQKQADLATDALDRRWALEMIAAVAARSNT